MKKVSIDDVAWDLSGYLQQAEQKFIVITQQDKVVGLLIRLDNADDWLEALLLQHPVFQEWIRQDKEHLRTGQSVTLEHVQEQYSTI